MKIKALEWVKVFNVNCLFTIVNRCICKVEVGNSILSIDSFMSMVKIYQLEKCATSNHYVNMSQMMNKCKNLEKMNNNIFS